MIRPLKERDIDVVIGIVNENWKTVYAGYINPELLNNAGCRKREIELKTDFSNRRLSEYVWEETGQLLALLSIGNTADSDKTGAFEVWRIYVDSKAQGKGIGGKLLAFAEQQANERKYSEIIIWAFKENIRALSFYQRHGYKIDKEEYLGEPYLTSGIRLIKKL